MSQFSTATRQRIILLAVAAIGVLLLAGAGVNWLAAKPDMMPVVANAARTIIVDCQLVSHAVAWVDQDANGKREANEVALQGVRLELNDQTHQRRNVAELAETEADGTALVREFLPGCPDIKFTIRAVPPPGFLPTTQVEVPEHEHVHFGFRRVR